MRQRVAGSLGTAIIAVVLQGHIQTAHSQAAVASGFGNTYWWVMGVTLIGLLPTLLLMRIERQACREASPAEIGADAPRLEAA